MELLDKFPSLKKLSLLLYFVKDYTKSTKKVRKENGSKFK